ncbi:peptidylprolyl isomerase [Spirulina major CS-329]|uniref:peptidylprolyl isomerase n=1 Tax=Spirulina TaxID=1154 RepID=UPI00232FEF18|nr:MULTISPECIES: peptidylprolyl isomerase [Spirulina]MDB9495785.1 peptidylprolyl isomerase [Spirulina subsalsa CS-330]MDB9503771.1 peptidylprolyl isomerase [Spirulina major CS-329]
MLSLHSSVRQTVQAWLKRAWLVLAVGAIALLTTATLAPVAHAGLAQGNAITDPQAILRYALPIDNPEVRQLQTSLESISEGLRSKRWSLVNREIKSASRSLTFGDDAILASVGSDRTATAQDLLTELREEVETLRTAADDRDKNTVWEMRRQALAHVGALEALMVDGFPFEIPDDYANLPQLQGRATVELETTQGTLTVIVDGYSAPINAGNFVDLVQRGFYDGLPFFQNQDYIIQTGDPEGPEVGFIDPKTKEYRAIPLEILVQGDKEPIYEITLEDAGLYLAELALPFNAYGAMALARPSDDPNGGSSQFFFFLFDSELTPPGFNVLDGRYSVFGYLVDGKEVLQSLQDGDVIKSARVVEGLDNFVAPRS